MNLSNQEEFFDGDFTKDSQPSWESKKLSLDLSWKYLQHGQNDSDSLFGLLTPTTNTLPTTLSQ